MVKQPRPQRIAASLRRTAAVVGFDAADVKTLARVAITGILVLYAAAIGGLALRVFVAMTGFGGS